MDAPCCDVFELADGKIKRFDCYPEGSVILTQLGVIGNLNAALEHQPGTENTEFRRRPRTSPAARLGQDRH